MPPIKDIEKCYSKARLAVDYATQVCMAEGNTPEEVTACMRELHQRIDQAEQVLQAQDPERMRAYMSDMKQLSEQARHAVSHADGIDDELREAVIEARHELSRLNYRLH